MAEQFRTAIVTGGVSGIGYGLVKHLLSKSQPRWRVVIADIRPEAYAAISSSLDPDRHLFFPTNVAVWDEQAALFKQAYEWSGGRIDFLAANAGTAERDHISNGLLSAGWDLNAEPPKPDLFAVETTAALKSANTTSNGASSGQIVPFNPKMVITASCAGLYPFPIAPLYNATKHAVLALTRAVGTTLFASDNIAVNCIMPAYVDTGLTPTEVTNLWPQHWITPISTMMRAYDELTSVEGAIDQDGKSDGVNGKVKAGQSVECVVERLFYRKPVDYADESQEYLVEQSFLPDGVWIRGMKEAIAKAMAAQPSA